MKYQEIERILHDITKEKNKLGKSLQKLVKIHKTEFQSNKPAKNLKEKATKFICKLNILNNSYKAF